MWKAILLNQFHDILPGSSIHEVYEVTKAEYAALKKDRPYGEGAPGAAGSRGGEAHRVQYQGL